MIPFRTSLWTSTKSLNALMTFPIYYRYQTNIYYVYFLILSSVEYFTLLSTIRIFAQTSTSSPLIIIRSCSS